MRDLPPCRQFLCTHCNLRACYRRAEKRCWVRDSCKPPGYTSPRLLPPRLAPQPSIRPPFSLLSIPPLRTPCALTFYFPPSPFDVHPPPCAVLFPSLYRRFSGWLYVYLLCFPLGLPFTPFLPFSESFTRPTRYCLFSLHLSSLSVIFVSSLCA